MVQHRGPSQVPPVRRLSYFNEALALCTLDFPIYYIEAISERHVVIGGGGGSSKTGVPNQIVIIELLPSNGSCYPDLVAKFQDIPDAIMTASLMCNQSIAETSLITGGLHPAIYKLDFDSPSSQFKISIRKTLEDPKRNAELKCVKCIPGKIFTGGTDGELACWDQIGIVKKIKAHVKEIDEIDVNIIDEHIVTLSRGEGRLSIWNFGLEKISEYTNSKLNVKATNVNYCLRSCKYAKESTSKETNSFLMVACNPIPAKGQPCLLEKLVINNNELSVVCTSKPISVDGIMAMTISSDGKYVAIGTRSGGVSIFSTKYLSQTYSISNAHYNPVTDLAFLPPRQESLTLTNSELCPLLSVSIDRRITLHRPKSQSLSMRWFKIILLMVVIYFLFFVFQKHISN